MHKPMTDLRRKSNKEKGCIIFFNLLFTHFYRRKRRKNLYRFTFFSATHTLLWELSAVIFSRYLCISRPRGLVLFPRYQQSEIWNINMSGFITLHFRYLRFQHLNQFNHPLEAKGKSQVFSEGELPKLSVLVSKRRVIPWACSSWLTTRGALATCQGL